MKRGILKNMQMSFRYLFIGLTVIFSSLLFSFANVDAAQITLAWNNVNEASGYKIYYGTTSNSYSSSIDAGNSTTQTMNLTDGYTYYFAATAYDDNGLESDYSNEVSYNTKTADTCTYSISPSTASFSSSGSTGTITVTTQSGCTWSASSGSSWVTITSGSNRTGSGTLTYSVASNSGTTRTTVSTIAGQLFTINQSGNASATANPCTYTISTTSKNFSFRGGAVNVRITATGATNCATPSAQNNRSWIGSSISTVRKNVWLLKVSAGANTSSQTRSGSVTVGSKNIAVNQGGAACSITGFTPISQSVSASGGSYRFAVNVYPEDCSWSVTQSSAFLHAGSTSGTGDASISYTVDANATGRARSGIIRVKLNTSFRNKVLRVTQSR